MSANRAPHLSGGFSGSRSLLKLSSVPASAMVVLCFVQVRTSRSDGAPSGVADSVGGEERQSEAAREFDECLVARFLVAARSGAAIRHRRLGAEEMDEFAELGGDVLFGGGPFVLAKDEWPAGDPVAGEAAEAF